MPTSVGELLILVVIGNCWFPSLDFWLLQMIPPSAFYGERCFSWVLHSKSKLCDFCVFSGGVNSGQPLSVADFAGEKKEDKGYPLVHHCPGCVRHKFLPSSTSYDYSHQLWSGRKHNFHHQRQGLRTVKWHTLGQFDRWWPVFFLLVHGQWPLASLSLQ